MQRGLSKENYDDWIKAIKLTKNTNTEANVKLYLEKITKKGHIVDIPCFIDSDAVKKSSEFTFQRALQEKDLGILQILASMNKNLNKGRFMYGGFRTSDIAIAAKEGNLNVIKILAPITKYPNSGNLTYQSESGYQTPMHEAAYEGHLDVLKFLMIRNSMFPQMDLLHFIVLPKEDILMYSKFWLQ